ncbi:DUF5110 domain-containing protein [Marivirga tractuosa]|uniref:DUF5110 domain-containing protein n=1 Tax=Marivirga tractuosa TaxID=1006 RepID=UPI0035D0BCD0
MQYVDEFVPENIKLHVYKTTNETESQLYEDDGLTKDFDMGISTLHTFTQKSVDNTTIIQHKMESEYESGSKGFEIHLHGFGNVEKIIVDGNTVSANNDSKIIVDRNFDSLEIIKQ